MYANTTTLQYVHTIHNNKRKQQHKTTKTTPETKTQDNKRGRRTGSRCRIRTSLRVSLRSIILVDNREGFFGPQIQLLCECAHTGDVSKSRKEEAVFPHICSSHQQQQQQEKKYRENIDAGHARVHTQRERYAARERERREIHTRKRGGERQTESCFSPSPPGNSDNSGTKEASRIASSRFEETQKMHSKKDKEGGEIAQALPVHSNTRVERKLRPLRRAHKTWNRQ